MNMKSYSRTREAKKDEPDHQSGAKITKDVATGLGISIALATVLHFVAPEELQQTNEKPAQKIQVDSAQAVQQLLKDGAKIPPFDPTTIVASEKKLR